MKSLKKTKMTGRQDACSTNRLEACSTSRQDACSTNRLEACSTSRQDACSTSRQDACSTNRLEACSTTYLLDEIIRAKKEKREVLRMEQIKKVLAALDKLAEQLSFTEAYLFGSLVKPYAFYPESDIDIGFTGLKDADFFKAMAFLSSELGREVDVIQMEGHRLTPKILKEGLRIK
jgi:hypothetical protein